MKHTGCHTDLPLMMVHTYSHALSCSGIMCKQMCSAHTPHLLVSLCFQGHIHWDAYPKHYALGTDKQRRKKYTHIHTKKKHGEGTGLKASQHFECKKINSSHTRRLQFHLFIAAVTFRAHLLFITQTRYRCSEVLKYLDSTKFW